MSQILSVMWQLADTTLQSEHLGLFCCTSQKTWDIVAQITTECLGLVIRQMTSWPDNCRKLDKKFLGSITSSSEIKRIKYVAAFNKTVENKICLTLAAFH